jgi:hypothetical protein
MQDLLQKFAKQLVPEDILLSFDVIDIDDSSPTDLIISLVEKSDLTPKHEKELVLNGFLKEVELTHFPANGRVCYLRLKRRRWKIKNQPASSESFYNSYDYTVEGTKATKSFGAFLKSFGK